jgi:hypothetical protein
MFFWAWVVDVVWFALCGCCTCSLSTSGRACVSLVGLKEGIKWVCGGESKQGCMTHVDEYGCGGDIKWTHTQERLRSTKERTTKTTI